MPVEGTNIFPIFSMEMVWLIVKILIILLSTLYFIFSLILVRQVAFMAETLMTEVTPILKGLSIIYAGVSLGVVILFIGMLFG